jgi:hypothetical protein
MSSKYRLRFCRPGGDLGYFMIAKPSLVTVRTLVRQSLLLPVVHGLFTPSTRLFDRISQVVHFRTQIDRVVHLVLDRWTFPDHSKNV